MEAETEQYSRRRARQRIREYELIWLLQAATALACCVFASLALALHAATAWPRHGSRQALITIMRRPLSVSRALHVLRSCVLCLAPPAVALLEALDRCVCTRRACCFCLLRRISHLPLLPLPLSFFLGLARRCLPSLASCSKLFNVAHCHSYCSLLLWRLVCTRQACCLFARVALLLLPLSLFLGVRAPSLSLVGFMF